MFLAWAGAAFGQHVTIVDIPEADPVTKHETACSLLLTMPTKESLEVLKLLLKADITEQEFQKKLPEWISLCSSHPSKRICQMVRDQYRDAKKTIPPALTCAHTLPASALAMTPHNSACQSVARLVVVPNWADTEFLNIGIGFKRDIAAETTKLIGLCASNPDKGICARAQQIIRDANKAIPPGLTCR